MEGVSLVFYDGAYVSTFLAAPACPTALVVRVVSSGVVEAVPLHEHEHEHEHVDS